MAWRKATPREWGMLGMGFGSGAIVGAVGMAAGAKVHAFDSLSGLVILGFGFLLFLVSTLLAARAAPGVA